MALLQRHGWGVLSYSTLQPGLHYFDTDYGYISATGRGFLRRQVKTALKAGVQVDEIPSEAWDVATLDRISTDWLRGQRTGPNELRFLARPMDIETDCAAGVRLFWAELDGRPVGFLMLDPISEYGITVGYYADIIRTTRDAPRGTTYRLLCTAVDIVFEEGASVFSFGIAPFHMVWPVYRLADGSVVVSETAPPDATRIDNCALTVFFRALFAYGSWLYDFEGLRIKAPVHHRCPLMRRVHRSHVGEELLLRV